MAEEKGSGAGMSLIVKGVANLVAAFILLFGICVMLYGHVGPGGGFAGGVAIACSFILLTLAFGQQSALRRLNRRVAGLLKSAGALIFLGFAVAGLAVADAFFESFISPSSQSSHGLFSAVFILVCEIGVTLVVSMGLFLVFTELACRRVRPDG